MDFTAVRCPKCRSVVMDGAFKGLSRARCPNKKCRRRVWVAGDGHDLRVVQVDKPPRELA